MKGDDYMILLTILTIMALLLLAIAIVTLSVGGVAFIAVFGDLIVCVVFIALIIRFVIRRKSKNRRRNRP